MHEPGEGLTEVSEKVTDGSEKVQEGEPGEGEVSRKCLGSVWGVSGGVSRKCAKVGLACPTDGLGSHLGSSRLISALGRCRPMSAVGGERFPHGARPLDCARRRDGRGGGVFGRAWRCPP